MVRSRCQVILASHWSIHLILASHWSRPESELLLDTGDREEGEVDREGEVEASPRQLEIMMNRSKERAHRDSR